MLLAIVGYRHFTDYRVFKDTVNDFVARHGMPKQVISGGAPGAYTMAKRWANEHKIELIVHCAEWDKHGDLAGPIRNTTIAMECTHMVAFPSRKKGRGTQDSINKFKRFKGATNVNLLVKEI